MCEIPHTVQSGFQKIEATIAVESPIAACREKHCSEAHSHQLRRPSLPGPSARALSQTQILGLFSLLRASELEVAPATGTEASFGLFILNGETESRGDGGPYSRSRIFPSGTQPLSAALLVPHCHLPSHLRVRESVMAAVQPCGGVPTCQCVLRPGEDHEGAEESISIINKPNPESLVVLRTVYIFPLYSSFQSITLSPENLGKLIYRVQGHIAKKWLGKGLSCLLCFFYFAISKSLLEFSVFLEFQWLHDCPVLLLPRPGPCSHHLSRTQHGDPHPCLTSCLKSAPCSARWLRGSDLCL